MGAFKDSTISDEADKALDYCDDCGNGIYVGQAIWKIGGGDLLLQCMFQKRYRCC